MVCAKLTLSSKIILDTPDGLLGEMGHMESRVGPFGHGVSVDVR
jgi:hypothetical protein